MIDEAQLNKMSFIFFEDILEQLGRRITYEGIVNYAGNSFCEKSWEMIMENNPIELIHEGGEKVNSKNKGLSDFFSHLSGRNMKKGTGGK